MACPGLAVEFFSPGLFSVKNPDAALYSDFTAVGFLLQFFTVKIILQLNTMY